MSESAQPYTPPKPRLLRSATAPNSTQPLASPPALSLGPTAVVLGGGGGRAAGAGAGRGRPRMQRRVLFSEHLDNLRHCPCGGQTYEDDSSDSSDDDEVPQGARVTPAGEGVTGELTGKENARRGVGASGVVAPVDIPKEVQRRTSLFVVGANIRGRGFA